jgi:hypothetical protein
VRPIHARCPGSGVTRDPIERHEQRRRGRARS